MSPTTPQFKPRDYRGATIEDLDIRPAISINPTTSILEAEEIAYENEFTFLPVIHESNRRLLGVLNVEEVAQTLEKNPKSTLEPITKNFMLWFSQKGRENYEEEHRQTAKEPSKTPLNSTIYKPKNPKGKKYHVLTPFSPLEKLADFFNTGMYFAIITNDDGDFVYGVATPEDLMKYEKARPKL
ncbi:predicted protein [Scheffersomyces stipitis CBS 6054]|uniref:CBS domain-containing protein n=1 Tax=Scheffersomyces stipitis (strain ATCC 58785 / CBS 6054 / NBRC 10063 / NRRL Y-11545) TaxID=322104 RepID=A3LYC4_PICST|nr:predicted protein [Scheffersomyces stipitis CBS 6054]ABN67958.1 predicted protein [Scheffersomyces stipitis CBS 6054]KAG2732380.1 hypothetical protein G9P44_004797 [Scheffersomyces stipitis]